MWRCIARGLRAAAASASGGGSLRSRVPRFFSTESTTGQYTIVDHTYDAIVVGAGALSNPVTYCCCSGWYKCCTGKHD
ncbi:hypothetical protein NL676_014523 [Syzygium grande]|nr:hypothetical protein NL676_014523 [Syzygium grande]